jgi:hypothetical protein
MFQDKLTKEIAAAAAQIKTEPTKNVVNGNSVEGAVVSIMANEELKGNQHKIDANKNGKIDAHDFKLLRGKKDMKKEEVEQLDEVGDTPAGRKALGSYVTKAITDKSKDRTKGLRKATSRMYKDNYYGKKTNEEVEQIDELSHDTLRSYVDKAKKENLPGKGGNRGVALLTPGTRDKGVHKAVDRMKKMKANEEVEQMDEAFPTVADAKKRMAAKESPFEKKKISTGTVYTRKYKEEPDEDLKSPSRRARDSSAVLGKGEHMAKKKKMSEMLDLYINHGVESLVENLMIEEPSQDEYKKEVEVAQAKSEGKIRNDKQIAKAATQGVKMEQVEIEVLDADEINGVQVDNIEERSMTSAEMNKREEIVKSMKKGIQGFKDRYGKDAKSVMYATATKNAMKD